MFYRLFSVLLACIAVSVGCRRLPPPPEGLPPLHPCTISVTFGGEAIQGVNISLVPKDSNSKWKSGGKTDESGKAVLRTSFAYPGAPEGVYTVGFDITKESHGDTAETMAPISLIPLKYRPDRSSETVEVKPGKNEFSFTLEGGEERLPVSKDSYMPKR